MCLVSKPKIPAPSSTDPSKPLPILRNPILDGLIGNISALRQGTNAFRIDLANPLTIPGGGPSGAGAGGGGGSSGGSSGGSTGGGSSTGGSSGSTKTDVSQARFDVSSRL